MTLQSESMAKKKPKMVRNFNFSVQILTDAEISPMVSVEGHPLQQHGHKHKITSLDQPIPQSIVSLLACLHAHDQQNTANQEEKGMQEH